MQFSDWAFLSEAHCHELQNQLRTQLVSPPPFDISRVQTVAGVDLAYWETDGIQQAVCCICVVQFPSGKLLEQQHTQGIVQFPYIPGCLAFRELPLVLETVPKLTIQPDVYLFDGNGMLHPRNMGIATHAGFYLKVPTIGCAKSYYRVKDTDFEMPEKEAGSFTEIVVDGVVCGRVLRTHTNVKPVFLSVGQRIGLEDATILVQQLVGPESHIPIPVRLADLATHEMRTYYQTT
ncbi:MAG: endonuclease V [Anaerotruncus sp.]|nr:endonuclease V [Anaerotruncus sp.]